MEWRDCELDRSEKNFYYIGNVADDFSNYMVKLIILKLKHCQL